LLQSVIGATKQLVEKGLHSQRIREKHTSAAKAGIHFAWFVPGMNPRPTDKSQAYR
jgi:hypothetical protein